MHLDPHADYVYSRYTHTHTQSVSSQWMQNYFAFTYKRIRLNVRTYTLTIADDIQQTHFMNCAFVCLNLPQPSLYVCVTLFIHTYGIGRRQTRHAFKCHNRYKATTNARNIQIYTIQLNRTQLNCTMLQCCSQIWQCKCIHTYVERAKDYEQISVLNVQDLHIDMHRIGTPTSPPHTIATLTHFGDEFNTLSQTQTLTHTPTSKQTLPHTRIENRSYEPCIPYTHTHAHTCESTYTHSVSQSLTQLHAYTYTFRVYCTFIV